MISCTGRMGRGRSRYPCRGSGGLDIMTSRSLYNLCFVSPTQYCHHGTRIREIHFQAMYNSPALHSFLRDRSTTGAIVRRYLGREKDQVQAVVTVTTWISHLFLQLCYQAEQGIGIVSSSSRNFSLLSPARPFPESSCKSPSTISQRVSGESFGTAAMSRQVSNFWKTLL